MSELWGHCRLLRLGIVGIDQDKINEIMIEVPDIQDVIIRKIVDIVSHSDARIVSGGASGVDTYARVAAEHYKRPFVEIKPIHNHWQCNDVPCYGFRARNMDIADACDKVIAITVWIPNSY